MLSKGDHVSVLDQDLKGIVMEILPSGKIRILDEGGMDWVFDEKELVAEKRMNREPPPSSETKQPEPEHEPNNPIVTANRLPALSIAFQIADDGDSFCLLLCNRTGHHILTSVAQKTNEQYNNMFSGKLLNGHNTEIATYRKGELNDIGTIAVDAIFFKLGPYEQKTPISWEMKVRPKKFLSMDNFETHDGLDQRAMVFEIKDVSNNKTTNSIARRSRPPMQNVRSDTDHEHLNTHQKIDLHMEKLVDDISNFSPSEMLEIQKQKCREAIDSAVADPHKLSLTIVHGHGKGVLKKAVISILKEYDLDYNQDLYLRTGQAAIEVRLK